MKDFKFNQAEIGEIGNYYGGIRIMKHDDKYYWLIENYDTNYDNLSDSSEIDKTLFDALVAHEEKRNPKNKALQFLKQ